jgi:4-amino-4-deoxy-L-arabinose transferase-like glycosyltransferase
MTLFSLVTVYLIGGFGIFYVAHSTSQPWYVTMLVALAWTVLLLWLFLANRPSEDR